MSNVPLLTNFEDNHLEEEIQEMPTKDDIKSIDSFDEVDGRRVLRPGSLSAPGDDPAAPSQNVSSTRQRISDLFTILCAGCALISDGYANSLMTLINVVVRWRQGRILEESRVVELWADYCTLRIAVDNTVSETVHICC